MFEFVWSTEPDDPASFTARFDRRYTRSAGAYAAAVRFGPVWRRWLRHALPHVRGDRVLEVSVGTGWLVSQYADRVDAIGVDLNAAMLGQAAASADRAGVAVPLVRADVGALPFRDGAFDTVVDTMAFSGYPDGDGAMAELGRVLAPRGRIVMIDVSFPADGNRIGTWLARAWQRGGDIIRDLPALFEAHGFTVATREIGGWGSVQLFVAQRATSNAVPDLVTERSVAPAPPERGAPLSPDQAGRVYDRIGRLQDTQGFYENAAVDDLIDHADLEHAHAVVELGPGTGRLAHRLLAERLAGDTRYTGIELSRRMVEIASDRLRPFGPRARVELGDITSEWPASASAADRVLATYVFDLLGDDPTDAVLARIADTLGDDGVLGIVSLTEGEGGAAAVSNAWRWVWCRWPSLVGGCRPIGLRERLEATGWRLDHHRSVTAWLVTSEVLVARPPTAPVRGVIAMEPTTSE